MHDAQWQCAEVRAFGASTCCHRLFNSACIAMILHLIHPALSMHQQIWLASLCQHADWNCFMQDICAFLHDKFEAQRITVDLKVLHCSRVCFIRLTASFQFAWLCSLVQSMQNPCTIEDDLLSLSATTAAAAPARYAAGCLQATDAQYSADGGVLILCHGIIEAEVAEQAQCIELQAVYRPACYIFLIASAIIL